MNNIITCIMSSEFDFAQITELPVFKINGIDEMIESIETFYDCTVSADFFRKCAKITIIDKNIKIAMWYHENECYYYYLYLYDRLIHTNINICSLSYAFSLIMSEIRYLML